MAVFPYKSSRIKMATQRSPAPRNEPVSKTGVGFRLLVEDFLTSSPCRRNVRGA